MGTLTFGQLEALLEARGATPSQADVGAAIAEAESGGRTDAQGDKSLGQGIGQYVGSLGPWQIFGQAHPSVSADCAEDPNCAADQVKLISGNFTNWNAWSTFKSGAYAKFLSSPADFTPAGSVPTPGPVANPGGNASLLADSSPVQLPAWMRALGIADLGDAAVRFVVLGLALVLIVVAIFTLFRGDRIAGAVARRAAVGAVLG